MSGEKLVSQCLMVLGTFLQNIPQYVAVPPNSEAGRIISCFPAVPYYQYNIMLLSDK